MTSTEKRAPTVGSGLSFKGPEYRRPVFARDLKFLFDLPARVVRDVHRRVAAGAGEVRHALQANGSLPVMPLYLPVPPVMMCVPHFMSGCDLSTSRVSKLEKIMSPSASASTQAPSI